MLPVMTPSADESLKDDADRGGKPPANPLIPIVYEQLRAIARQRMAGERRDHTLQATALVHEAYLRLSARAGTEIRNPAQFYVAAAEAMRRILVEHARARGRDKRGGGRRREPLPLNVVDLASEADPGEILTLDEALCRLEGEDPEAAQVVRLRFFAGLSVDETATALGLSPSTVDRDWAYARAWLRRAIDPP
jgi:RNA polymerase sigma factor (TIGR02999 family)